MGAELADLPTLPLNWALGRRRRMPAESHVGHIPAPDKRVHSVDRAVFRTSRCTSHRTLAVSTSLYIRRDCTSSLRSTHEKELSKSRVRPGDLVVMRSWDRPWAGSQSLQNPFPEANSSTKQS